ncbi:MAG TPA: nuclear transport factor 2 family protein [Chitinophagaceae bacterium]|nr:nuclear transport factor 2 family protein [Chitinophagaceae bacterium]
MRICATVFLLFLFFSGFSQATDKNKSAILKTLEKQTEAWNSGDIEGFMKGYWENDSLTFIGKNGVTYGWTNTLNNYKRGYPDTAAMGKLSFTILEVKKLSKKYYHITGKWFLKRSVGDVGGHFTLLFEKINDRWVIIKDHSS